MLKVVKNNQRDEWKSTDHPQAKRLQKMAFSTFMASNTENYETNFCKSTHCMWENITNNLF